METLSQGKSAAHGREVSEVAQEIPGNLVGARLEEGPLHPAGSNRTRAILEGFSDKAAQILNGGVVHAVTMSLSR